MALIVVMVLLVVVVVEVVVEVYALSVDHKIADQIHTYAAQNEQTDINLSVPTHLVAAS